MGKVTIELNEVDHKKLKMICINNDVKIKDYPTEKVKQKNPQLKLPLGI